MEIRKTESVHIIRSTRRGGVWYHSPTHPRMTNLIGVTSSLRTLPVILPDGSQTCIACFKEISREICNVFTRPIRQYRGFRHIIITTIVNGDTIFLNCVTFVLCYSIGSYTNHIFCLTKLIYSRLDLFTRL
jgi:hypothetical protein